MPDSLADIERRLPWGFHDARLFAMSVDYTTNRAQLALEVLEEVSEPDERGERHVVYRRATLTLDELEALIILPRDAGTNPGESGGYLDIDGSDGVPAAAMPMIGDLQILAPYAFFVEQWNSFIIVAARLPSLALHEARRE